MSVKEHRNHHSLRIRSDIGSRSKETDQRQSDKGSKYAEYGYI